MIPGDLLAQRVDSSRTQTFVDPRAGALTVEQFYADWAARQVWTSGTGKAMKLAVSSTTFYRVRLGDLRPSHLEQWVKAMAVKGLAESTIRTRFNNVHALLRAAHRDRMIVSDPAADIRLRRGRAREATMAIPTVRPPPSRSPTLTSCAGRSACAGRCRFVGNAGQPPHQNTVSYGWRRARAAAGMPTLRLHDLRHFFASGLIADGCDVVTVQRALGHRSATTTLNTYAHLWPSAEDRTRAAAGRFFASTLSAVYPGCTEVRFDVT